MISPQVSVITLAHNRRENVAELLCSLRRQSYEPFEVILIDNNSDDGTASMVKEDFPEVNLIELEDNLGTVAYNHGLICAKGKYLAIIDDDGLPGDENWIQQIVECFDGNPLLGVVCCNVRMRDTGLIAHDSPQFIPERRVSGGYPAVAFNGTGAGLRAEALSEVGFFNQGYFMMYLELHLCTRLLDAGWEVRHFPAIEVWHSRPSGSSYPAMSFFGLRNYYWYVWEFYPCPMAILETLHEISSRLKLVIRGELPLRSLINASFSAIREGSHIIRSRKPVSSEVLAYLRSVRHWGNQHGLAAKHRQYSSRNT